MPMSCIYHVCMRMLSLGSPSLYALIANIACHRSARLLAVTFGTIEMDILDSAPAL